MLCKSTISKVPVLNNSCSLLLFLSSEVMLKLLTLVFSVLFALVSQAHDFYFAFAEVAYDEITERLQVTVIVTTHDLEKSKKYPMVIDFLSKPITKIMLEELKGKY